MEIASVSNNSIDLTTSKAKFPEPPSLTMEEIEGEDSNDDDDDEVLEEIEEGEKEEEEVEVVEEIESKKKPKTKRSRRRQTKGRVSYISLLTKSEFKEGLRIRGPVMNKIFIRCVHCKLYYGIRIIRTHYSMAHEATYMTNRERITESKKVQLDGDCIKPQMRTRVNKGCGHKTNVGAKMLISATKGSLVHPSAPSKAKISSAPLSKIETTPQKQCLHEYCSTPDSRFLFCKKCANNISLHVM